MFSFSPAVDYAAGENPQAVATADFNGDGRLDLAVGNYNYSASTVTVLLGNTNGTFSSDPRLTSPTGDSPRSLAVGDFNADGKLDLATGNTYDVSVLLGDGTGAFGAPASLNVYGSPAGVAVGDVNADGKLDLVAASNNYYPGGYGYAGFYQGHVVVLLGNGTGAFASPVATRVSTSGAPIASVALADFNGDRRLDAATVDTGSWWGGGHVAVALGNGTATFAPFAAVAAVDYAQSVTAADVSGDGRADLVTASANNGVGVTLGNGAGGFGDTRVYAPGTHVNSVALADFDGNGAVDLLTASPTDGAAGVLLGAGGGTFRPPLPAGTGSRPFPAAVGDFNGDRRVDAVSANDVSKRVSVLLNDGNWLATDAPSIGISDVTVTEGNAGAVNAALTLTLSAASTKTVTVSFATSDVTATAAEGDYAPSSGAVTFAPGELTKTINVAVNGDRTAESRELFWVVLSGATNAFVDDSAGLVSILDDEPRVSIDDYSAAEGNADTKSFTFTVRLSAPSDAPLSVNYSTAEGDTDYWPSDPYYGPAAATAGSDFQAGAGTVTFAPGETSQTITVTVNGDTDGEPDEVFSVNLGVPDGAEVTDGHAVGTIVDDEVYASITGGGSVTEGDAGTKALAFTVTLSAPSDKTVTVNYATADGAATLAGGDYVSQSGTLSFAAGETSKTVTVAVKGDRVGEQDEDFYVNLTGSTNAAIAGGTGYAYVADDEPRISVFGANVTEGNSGTKSMTFTVRLAAAYDQAVTVNYATRDGSATVAGGDYVARSGTLTFAVGETSKTFTVTIRGDKQKEADESFAVLLSGPSLNAVIANEYGWGTIFNDDGKPGGRGGVKGNR